MTELRPGVRDLVDRAFPGGRVTPLAGDASQRSFFRVTPATGDATLVLMDYGESFVGDTDDMILTEIFRRASLPVPRIERSEAASGCLLLEDLGDRTLAVALAATDPAPLLRQATLLAVDVAVRGTPALAASTRATGPALDESRFRFEMDFFLEHYVGRHRGIASPSATLRKALGDLAASAADTPRRVLCHRDYHSRNLMVVGEGGMAMVDIQDARWGPDTYDLASILYDAYIDLPDGLRERLMETYRLALPQPPDAAAFRRRFDRVAAERMIKALGTFGYQVAKLGRQRYAEGIPRTLRRLERLLPTREETVALHRALGEHGLLDAPSA